METIFTPHQPHHKSFAEFIQIFEATWRKTDLSSLSYVTGVSLKTLQGFLETAAEAIPVLLEKERAMNEVRIADAVKERKLAQEQADKAAALADVKDRERKREYSKNDIAAMIAEVLESREGHAKTEA